MPTARYFARSPPFPSVVPLASIPTLSFTQLSSNDATKSARLYSACREHGIFQLDLSGLGAGESLLADAERMYELMASTFDLDESILEKYPIQALKSSLGYKRTGMMKDLDGTPDAMEVYTIGQDDAMGLAGTHRENPATVENSRQDLRQFFIHSNRIVNIVFNHLDTHLGLQPGTLTNFSSLSKPSGTGLRMLKTQPNPTFKEHRVRLAGHTDIGVITLLFNVLGGLQIIPAGQPNELSNWRYIKPEPGCASVNLGDTLIKWTSGVLRSGLHRVVAPPGEQQWEARYSLAYQVKAEDGATMRQLNGRQIPELGEGEKNNDMNVNEWAAERAAQIFRGELKPETRGGIMVE